MTYEREYPDGSTREYCGVMVRTADGYEVRAPDDSVVLTASERPTEDTARSALSDAGYTVSSGSHLPFRDLTVDGESVPW